MGNGSVMKSPKSNFGVSKKMYSESSLTRVSSTFKKHKSTMNHDKLTDTMRASRKAQKSLMKKIQDNSRNNSVLLLHRPNSPGTRIPSNKKSKERYLGKIYQRFGSKSRYGTPKHNFSPRSSFQSTNLYKTCSSISNPSTQAKLKPPKTQQVIKHQNVTSLNLLRKTSPKSSLLSYLKRHKVKHSSKANNLHKLPFKANHTSKNHQ